MNRHGATRDNSNATQDSLAGASRRNRVARRKAEVSIYVFILLAGLAVGVFAGRMSLKSARRVSAETVVGVTRVAKPGPWGNLGFLPITIAAPAELLSVRNNEEKPVRWFFPGQSREGLALYLDFLKVAARERDAFFKAGQFQAQPNGVEVVPPREFVFGVEPKALHAIYQTLASSRNNDWLREYFMASQLDEVFKHSNVRPETVALLRQASAVYGRYLVCYALTYVVSAIPTYEEKVDFLKAISKQETMLAKLRVTPQSDINALASYWGKACWSTDVKALLESLSHVPGGGQLDIIELLPPLPTSLLYTYPPPQNPLNGAVVKRDCQWTSFNFFRDPPDPRFNDAAYILQELKTEYYPIKSDPRFGDVLLFFTPKGDIIHSAVFLADDVVFTKNGDNATRPWIFSTIEDLVGLYSFNVTPGKELGLQYYRHKYY